MASKFKIGDRVTRPIDVFNRYDGIRSGFIKNIYSLPKKTFTLSGLVLGPYPELYEVEWDDGTIDKGCLPHEITKENK